MMSKGCESFLKSRSKMFMSRSMTCIYISPSLQNDMYLCIHIIYMCVFLHNIIFYIVFSCKKQQHLKCLFLSPTQRPRPNRFGGWSGRCPERRKGRQGDGTEHGWGRAALSWSSTKFSDGICMKIDGNEKNIGNQIRNLMKFNLMELTDKFLEI